MNERKKKNIMFSSPGQKGYCICVRCGYRMTRVLSLQCRRLLCPECGGKMIREIRSSDEL